MFIYLKNVPEVEVHLVVGQSVIFHIQQIIMRTRLYIKSILMFDLLPILLQHVLQTDAFQHSCQILYKVHKLK